MALIKCPECGREVSDRAPACVHCGFPLQMAQAETYSIEDFNDAIAEVFLDFKDNPDDYNRKLINILPQVKEEVRKLKREARQGTVDDTSAQDAIAIGILTGLIINKMQVSWPVCKSFCEQIDFDSLSDVTKDRIAKRFCSLIQKDSDYNWDIMFWFPIYKILECEARRGTDELTRVLKDNSDAFGQSKYSAVMSFAKTNTDSIVEKVIRDDRNAGKLCCPKCGSTNVTTGARGYNIWTGFLGSGKTVNRCGSCGHMWKP